jgi:HK97 family phage major capsid protein
MTFLSDAAAGILTPEQVGELVIRPIQQASVAMQVTTVAQTSSPVFRIPIVDTDASAAWVPEGNDIVTNDAVVDEEQVTPLKVAALVKISTELAEDSSPEAAGLVQDSLARSVARKIDAAFFANTTPNGPNGLLSLTGVQNVAAGSFANFDFATSAKTLLRKVGSAATSFIASADTVGTLSTIKSFTGTITSNEPLLSATEADVTQATPETILGVPLVAVADGTALADNIVWALDRRKVFCVFRRNVTFDISPHFFFGSDSIAVKVTCRVGFGYPQHTAIVKVTASGS